MQGSSSQPRRVLASGRPWPLGASVDGAGVNFAVFSAHASRVELCLFDDDGMASLDLPGHTDEVFHGYLEGGRPGLRYAFRVHGPAATGGGDRFDAHRLLLDPAAHELSGEFSWQRGDERDSVYGLRCRVVTDAFDWGGDRPPAVPWTDTVLYEVHVKGATRQHPDVPGPLRGSYAGLAAPAMLAHYKRLGVTTLNLLPIQQFIDEAALVGRGLHNYWGYNPINFFTPEPRYASGTEGRSAADELRRMVRDLHAAGIEVVLDVVFNHTAETDHLGPTLSWRGIDNRSYYRLAAKHPGRYENHSGCGNTPNLAHPRVLQQVMDALRHWVTSYHVDGFRFDLATSLVRDSAFLAAVRQDPVLQAVKLIAEPWDLGPDGYRLGRFPAGWGEWNDRFRDDVRAFWLTGSASVGALAHRLAGSSEVFRTEGRLPQAGINFITAHDGFTLRDLLSYNERNNEANGEANRDGQAVNHAWNCGVEGETTDPVVLSRRLRLSRALLATLYFSQGTPMLQGGDELGRSQQGNNNAYCQDNALTWFDWAHRDNEQIDFVAGLAALRRRLPLLRQRRWLTGEAGDGTARPDCAWWHPSGRAMTVTDWHNPTLGCAGMWLAAAGQGELLILFNRAAEPVDCALPAGDWRLLCDSAAAEPFAEAACNGRLNLAARSVVLLERAA